MDSITVDPRPDDARTFAPGYSHDVLWVFDADVEAAVRAELEAIKDPAARMKAAADKARREYENRVSALIPTGP